MPGILVYSERPDVAHELIHAGRRLADERSGPLSVAVVGSDPDAAIAGGDAEMVYVVSSDRLEDFQFDSFAGALAGVVEACEADVVLVGSTRRGRALAPRLAQKLGAACVTDAKSVENRDGRIVTSRLALGGSTVKEEAVTSAMAVIAVSPGAFEADEATGASGGPTTELHLEIPVATAETVHREVKAQGAVDIEQAERLICIGRGVASEDDLGMIERLAEVLGAEMAATRPLAYEHKWMPEDRMVGISGKTVSPELYVVIGSSGQIQHTVSVRDSKLIVAINDDRSAPIFEMADYGIVGDLYELVPRLTEELS